MKNKSIIRVVLFLVLISFCFNFSYLISFNSKISATQNKIKSEIYLEGEETFSLKTSGYWNLTGSPILINGLSSTGDWAYTASNNDWCSGSGTWSDPYIIENVIIDAQNSDNCLLIDSTDDYFIIRNCTFYNSNQGSSPYYNAGIKLFNARNGIIINNNIFSNYGSGIALRTLSNNNTITGNLISGNSRDGIFLRDRCRSNTISGNTIENCRTGININDDCKFNLIKENKVRDNRDEGIGIFAYSEFNTLTMNKVSNSTDYGIAIQGFSDNNMVYENFVVREGNNPVSSLGSIALRNNTWNNSRIGNYYDIYLGEDSDKDGIGDSDYFIDTGVYDFLPIVDNEAPNITIDSPLSNEIFTETIPTFNVTIQDRYLDEMWYTLNEGTVKYYFTENGSIDPAAWESLPDGMVKIRFYGIDLPENEAYKEVIVRKGLPLTSISSYNFGITISSIFIALVVSIVFLRKKQKK